MQQQRRKAVVNAGPDQHLRDGQKQNWSIFHQLNLGHPAIPLCGRARANYWMKIHVVQAKTVCNENICCYDATQFRAWIPARFCSMSNQQAANWIKTT